MGDQMQPSQMRVTKFEDSIFEDSILGPDRTAHTLPVTTGPTSTNQWVARSWLAHVATWHGSPHGSTSATMSPWLRQDCGSSASTQAISYAVLSVVRR